MSSQTVKRFWNNVESETTNPSIKIERCVCGKLPSYYASSGGFNYYGYYKCNNCNLFATGKHQFPAIGIKGFGDNENNEPKLFVVYREENNPENGWNQFIENYTLAQKGRTR